MDKFPDPNTPEWYDWAAQDAQNKGQVNAAERFAAKARQLRAVVSCRWCAKDRPDSPGICPNCHRFP